MVSEFRNVFLPFNLFFLNIGGIDLKKSIISTILTIFIILACCLMSACDPGFYSFDYDYLKENVVKIEFINYDVPETRKVRKVEEILNFDENKAEVLKVLEEEEYDDFLMDLSKIDFHISNSLIGYWTSAKGTSIRLVYENNKFLIVCCSDWKSNFVTEFNSDGIPTDIILSFTGPSEFDALVDKYLNKVNE